MYKKYLIIFVLVLLVVGGTVLAIRSNKNATSGQQQGQVQNLNPVTYIVTLGKDGFAPNELTIHQGDIVQFKTTTGQPFWPASDLHPTHTIYPEFDPKQPIDPASSWSFTFNKVGTWKYHNHLFPTQRGVITVLGPNGQPASSGGCTNQKQCWEDQIEGTLKQQGLDAAFQLVTTLYATQPTFSSDCHDYLHKLGEAAFTLYSDNKPVQLSPATAYCGYGFYHGFMEKLLTISGNIQGAGDFCNYVAKQATQVLVDACYHGLGHGAEALATSNPSRWGDPQALLKPAFHTCQQVTDSDSKYSRCESGIFMEMAQYYIDHQYNLEVDVKAPLHVCEIQEPRDKADCYRQMQNLVDAVSGRNFAKSAYFDEQIKEDEYAVEAIRTLAGATSLEPAEAKKNASTCRSLQSRLRTPCIEGLAIAFMLRGTPGVEYKDALNFCNSSAILASERSSCGEAVLQYASQLYTHDKMSEVCTFWGKKTSSFCS